MDDTRLRTNAGTLLEMAAYCLLLALQYQVFFWQLGVGANGKSVYLHVLRHLLGVNSVSAIPLQRLGARFQNAALLGRRANIACDVSEMDKLRIGYIKQLSDGSLVDFERKFRDTVTTIVPARLFFASNNFPPVPDRSNGVWRRLILIPCEAQVEREIPQYEKRLTKELPGILNLVLAAGANLLRRDHFDVPERCQLAKEEYRLELDTSRSFCRECLVCEKGTFAVSDEIYSWYRGWCSTHGNTPVNSANFWRAFRAEMQKYIADGTIAQKKPTLKGGRRVPGWAGLRYVESHGEIVKEPASVVVPVEPVLPAVPRERRSKQEIAAAADGYTPGDLRKHKEWERAEKKAKLEAPPCAGVNKPTEAEVDELLASLTS